MVWNAEGYYFLLSDLLLFAKPTGPTYHLKCYIPLTHAECSGTLPFNLIIELIHFDQMWKLIMITTPTRFKSLRLEGRIASRFARKARRERRK